MWCYLRFLAAEQKSPLVRIPKDGGGQLPFSRRYFRKILNDLAAKKVVFNLKFSSSRKGSAEVLIPRRTNPELLFQVSRETRNYCSGKPGTKGPSQRKPGTIVPGSSCPGTIVPGFEQEKPEVNPKGADPQLELSFKALKELKLQEKQEILKEEIILMAESERAEALIAARKIVKIPSLKGISAEALLYAVVRCLQTQDVKDQRNFIYQVANREESSFKEIKAKLEAAAWSGALSGTGGR